MSLALARFTIGYSPKAGKVLGKSHHSPSVLKALHRTVEKIRLNPFAHGVELYRHPGHRRAAVDLHHRLIYTVSDHHVTIVDFDTRENIERWY